MTKTCLTCGNKMSGRIDKKFCNISCKNDFHNMTHLQKSSIEKMVGAAIRRNREILKYFFSQGLLKLEKSQLENFGFSFQGITGIEEGNQKVVRYFCYEYSISPKGNSFVLNKAG